MAETKWTPGPWSYVAVAGGWDGVADPGGAIVCELSLNEPANARLIAAAPDLYEALEAITHWNDCDGRVDASWWEAARAALAKARGES